MRLISISRFKNSLSPAEKRRFKNWYPVPGWKGDPQPRFGKFERWHKRPDAAQRLYWVTHPKLYDIMCHTQTTGKTKNSISSGIFKKRM